ncbi:MAG: hypothetical protein ACI9JY_002472, partial [Saprospiraceae bacterium]
TAAFAQNFSISGKVVAKKTQVPMSVALIALAHPWGEVFKSDVAKANGNFELTDIGMGGYLLKISFLGYQDFQQEVTISNENITLGQIELIENALELEGVEVTAKIPLATIDGDTTSYNADAYKTLADASAEDLIEKMPGVVIKDGKVQAQGEDITEVLVDGKPFFGNDPTAALRNLPAEVIDKIQVFDQKSEQAQFSGFDDGETSKTINIITKTNRRNGQFGKVYAGYGTDDRYQIGGNASLFDGNRRISIIGQSNNINQQNFSTEDLLGVVGSGGKNRRGDRSGRGRGRRGGSSGGNVNDFLVQQSGGITQTHAFGLNYSDKWGEKFNVSGSYFFNYSDNESDGFANTEYVDSESVSEFYTENSTSESQNTNHRINLRLEYQIDSTNSISIRPRITWQLNDGFALTDNQGLLGTDILSQANSDFRSDLTGLDFSNSLLFRHKFKKRGRTFSINLKTGYKDQSGESFLNSKTAFFTPPESLDTLDQFANLNVTGGNLSTNLSYTEPLSEKSSLLFNYRTSMQQDQSEKSTFDLENQSDEYVLFNEELSSDFDNYYYKQQIGGGYNFREGRDLFILARANLQWSKLESKETFPTINNLSRTYYNVLPFFMIKRSFSKQENLRFFYRSNTQSPSIEQVQNVLDNSNPLQLSIGNPALDQTYSHQLNARYSKTNTDKATILYAMIGATYTDDFISNATYLENTNAAVFNQIMLQPGTQLSQPVNLDKYWNFRTYFTYGMPLGKLKTNLNLDANANYTRTPGLINDVLNYSKNATAGLGITFSSNINEKIDFTFSTRTTYNVVENTVQANGNSKYWQQKSRLKLGWILPKGIIIRTDLTHQFYNGLSDGFNQNYTLWNAAIGKKLFNNERGEIALTAFDLLSENQSITRNVTEIAIEDVQTTVLQRYFMLKFTYNFRNWNTGGGR